MKMKLLQKISEVLISLCSNYIQKINPGFSTKRKVFTRYKFLTTNSAHREVVKLKSLHSDYIKIVTSMSLPNYFCVAAMF